MKTGWVFFSDSYVCSSLFLMMIDAQNMSTTFKILILFLTLLIFYLIFFCFATIMARTFLFMSLGEHVHMCHPIASELSFNHVQLSAPC